MLQEVWDICHSKDADELVGEEHNVTSSQVFMVVSMIAVESPILVLELSDNRAIGGLMCYFEIHMCLVHRYMCVINICHDSDDGSKMFQGINCIRIDMS